MRKAVTVRNTQITLSGKTPMELAMGRRPRHLLDPASKNPEQLTSTPTKQDLLNEEIQKLAMRTHLEVQQREDIRRDLAERMKFVPPDLRSGEKVFIGKTIRAKASKDGNPANGLNVEIIAIKGPVAIISIGSAIFQTNISKLKRPLGTVDLDDLPDSRERTGAPVQWLSCEGKADFWEMFSDNSYLSAILDRQGLVVAAPIDLRTKKADNFTPQLLQGFW